MNTRRLVLSLIALFIGFTRHLAAADVQKQPGYNVLVEVSYNEAGEREGATVVESDDFTGDQLLNQIALELSKNLPKQTQKLKDGKPVKFKVRAPFNFPVEGDEGPAANEAPKPALHTGDRPKFPEALAAKGENGGAILELSIGDYGNVQNIKVLRASHQEYAAAAVEALKSWIFMPAQKDGVNIESRWRIAIGFSVDGKNVDLQWRVAPRPSIGGYIVVRPKAGEAPASAAMPTTVPAK